MCTTSQSPILEVTRENFFAKLVIPITLPSDTLLVHCQLSLVARKSVCIIKQTPSNKATRDNGLSIWGGIFGLTLRCFTCFTPFFQLLIISALNISEQKAMLNNQYMNIYLYSNHVSTYWRKQLMKLKIVIGKRVKRLQLLYYVPMSIISENHNSVCFAIFQYDSHHPRPTFFFHTLDYVGKLMPAQCQKIKEIGDLTTGELAIEATVNGSRLWCLKIMVITHNKQKM